MSSPGGDEVVELRSIAPTRYMQDAFTANGRLPADHEVQQTSNDVTVSF